MKCPDEFLSKPASADLLDEAIDSVRFGYATPGCWAAVAVLARQRKLPVDALLERIHHGTQGYAKAIGIQAALDEEDTYAFERKNAGKNYSPLVVLADAESVDGATASIGSCIRHWFQEPQLRRFVADLCDVVGDLHDNVWSHAESTGVSMAQRWSCPHSGGKDSFIEFALADAGRGFFNELNRSGISRRESIEDAQGAIAWCIVRGHSSKIKEEDPWAQSMPPDMMGNPTGAPIKIKLKENNHLGLGLAKLVELVERYHGELWLASGDCLLKIDDTGRHTYCKAPLGWPGVLLSCRFRTSVVARELQQAPAVDDLDCLISSLLEDDAHGNA